jgi:hypothetical protein
VEGRLTLLDNITNSPCHERGQPGHLRSGRGSEGAPVAWTSCRRSRRGRAAHQCVSGCAAWGCPSAWQCKGRKDTCGAWWGPPARHLRNPTDWFSCTVSSNDPGHWTGSRAGGFYQLKWREVINCTINSKTLCAIPTLASRRPESQVHFLCNTLALQCL